MMLTCCNDEEILQDMARWSVIYHNAIRKYLEGNLKLSEDPVDYNSYLHEDEVMLMHETHKMRQMAPLKIRQLIAKAQPPMAMAIALNSQLEMAQIGAGDCVRIYSQSLPYPFTLMTTGFIQIWLYLLPLALKNTDLQLQVALPGSIFTVLLLLGVDAVAIQLENPFPYMPLQDLCNSSQRDVYRALDEHKLLLESAARNAGKPPPAGALKAAKGTFYSTWKIACLLYMCYMMMFYITTRIPMIMVAKVRSKLLPLVANDVVFVLFAVALTHALASS